MAAEDEDCPGGSNARVGTRARSAVLAVMVERTRLGAGEVGMRIGVEDDAMWPVSSGSDGVRGVGVRGIATASVVVEINEGGWDAACVFDPTAAAASDKWTSGPRPGS
jgi:hypothetical protein